MEMPKLLRERCASLFTKFMDVYGDTKVKGVLLPLPPAETKGVIYMPDSFTSKTFDENAVYHSGADVKVLKVAPTDLGPGFLFEMKISNLLTLRDWGNEFGLHSSLQAACASIDFHVMMTDDEGKIWADQGVVNRLSWGSSCNGGSHVVFPSAPFITSIVQRQRDSGKMDLFDQKLVFADPFESEQFFPDEIFGLNKWLDDKVGMLYHRKDDKNLNKLGQWALSYMARMDNNILKLEEVEHEVAS